MGRSDRCCGGKDRQDPSDPTLDRARRCCDARNSGFIDMDSAQIPLPGQIKSGSR